MAHKATIRLASHYEESLSSHSSCRDGLSTKREFDEVSSKYSSIIAYECLTPTKNAWEESDHSFSLKKEQERIIRWENELKDNENEKNYWVHLSENSRLRKRENTMIRDKPKTKKFFHHIKALKFEEELTISEFDKENQSMKFYFDSSEDEESEVFKHEGKRKVGRVLYAEQKLQIVGLDLIQEEDTQK